jgi:hypothetical protein
MKTKLVVTDLTRMHGGRVCIAGYGEDRRCIRPVLSPPGIDEGILTWAGEPVIFPFSQIELDLLQPVPQPPHTEDIHFNPWSIRFVRRVQDRLAVLEWSLFDQVSAIFEQPVHDDPGFYVMDCQGPRSVGTVQPKGITRVQYSAGPEGTWDYRLMFCDRGNTFYRLKITDLTWHYYCDHLRGPGCEPAQIADQLTRVMKSSQVYLRIGLARGWKKFPERCYLQINAIYTFPDYLEGKTFSDFRPKPEKAI